MASVKPVERGLIARPPVIRAPSLRIYVLDPSWRLRAAIVRHLLKAGLKAQPCETLDELPRTFPGPVVLLVADEAELVRSAVGFLASKGIDAPVIAYAQRAAAHRVVAAVQAGAANFLEWPDDQDILKPAIDQALGSGEPYVTEPATDQRSANLSKREFEVLQHAAHGLTLAELAVALGINLRTARVHRTRVLQKLSVHSLDEAVLRFRENRLAGPGEVPSTSKAPAALSDRELQVLRLISEGHSSLRISERLGIARKTVEAHRANISVKLNARNSSDAVRIALKHDYI